MLEDLKYIIHLDDYYVYKCDTYTDIHINESLKGLPRAKAICFDFTPNDSSVFLLRPRKVHLP